MAVYEKDGVKKSEDDIKRKVAHSFRDTGKARRGPKKCGGTTRAKPPIGSHPSLWLEPGFLLIDALGKLRTNDDNDAHKLKTRPQRQEVGGNVLNQETMRLNNNLVLPADEEMHTLSETEDGFILVVLAHNHRRDDTPRPGSAEEESDLSLLADRNLSEKPYKGTPNS